MGAPLVSTYLIKETGRGEETFSITPPDFAEALRLMGFDAEIRGWGQVLIGPNLTRGILWEDALFGWEGPRPKNGAWLRKVCSRPDGSEQAMKLWDWLQDAVWVTVSW